MMPSEWPDHVDAPTARALEASHDAPAEEWLFTCWVPIGAADAPPVGVVSGYRRFARGRSWYWAAVARPGHPLLHVADWSVPPRPDPLLVKGDGLWAEHVCDAPLEQWTVANETYAAALDDPAEALGRAYGAPTALACDLEWYATGPATPLRDGYEQPGVVHATIELAGEPALRLAEAPAHRWHRWGDVLGPVELPVALAHTGVRAPFAFPDGTTADWALTTDGWRARTGPTG
jgi:hypothetical protein